MDSELFWNPEKEEWLKRERDLSFTLVTDALERGDEIFDIQHPDLKRPHQRMLLFKLGAYICAVPYVPDGEKKFLKTMYLSRDWTKALGGEHE
jgi:hypothetical protein